MHQRKMRPTIDIARWQRPYQLTSVWTGETIFCVGTPFTMNAALFFFSKNFLSAVELIFTISFIFFLQQFIMEETTPDTCFFVPLNCSWDKFTSNIQSFQRFDSSRSIRIVKERDKKIKKENEFSKVLSFSPHISLNVLDCFVPLYFQFDYCRNVSFEQKTTTNKIISLRSFKCIFVNIHKQNLIKKKCGAHSIRRSQKSQSSKIFTCIIVSMLNDVSIRQFLFWLLNVFHLWKACGWWTILAKPYHVLNGKSITIHFVYGA